MRHARSLPRQQRGAGLIEVLIAVLIMGIGLLGIAAMQTTALRNTSSSLDRSQAVIQNYAIAEALRSNLTETKTFAFNTPLLCAVPAAGSAVQNEIRFWIQSLKDTLGDRPTTCGQINCTMFIPGANTARCTITAQWDDSRAADGLNVAGNAAQTVVTQTSF